MEIQKFIVVFLLTMMISSSILSFFRKKDKPFQGCPVPIDLWQFIMFNSLSFTVIVNILALILFRMQVAQRIKICLSLSTAFFQLFNILCCVVGCVLIGIAFKKDPDCIHLKTYKIVILLLAAFAYWFVVCGITSLQITAVFTPNVRFNNQFEDFEPDFGLNEAQIQLIPQETIKEEGICSICLENIQIGTLAKVIPRCGHKFHEPCILPWLLNNNICPYCRRSIVIDQI